MTDKQREAFEKFRKAIDIAEMWVNYADSGLMLTNKQITTMAEAIHEFQAQQAADVDGCQCQQCGAEFMGDLLVPDDVWEKIKPTGKPCGSGILCPSCIVSNIVSNGLWSAATALDVDQQAAGAEPVGYIHVSNNGHTAQLFYRSCDIQPLGEGEHNIYASPQPPKAVPDDLAMMVIDSIPALIDACGNSYVNAWLQSHLETARKYGFWSGPVIGDKENILSSVDSYLSHPGPSTTACDDQEAPDDNS